MQAIRTIIAGVLFSAALFGATGTQAAPLEVRVGWVVAPGGLAPLIFDDAYRNPDITKHYGKSYTVKTFKFRGSTPQITALAAGELNIAQLAFSSFSLAIVNAKLTDLRIVADIFQDGVGDYLTQEYLVHGKSDIRKVEDLKGKTIGVNAFGGALDIAQQAYLKKRGLMIDRDFKEVEVSFSSMVAAFGERRVDMIGMGMPFKEIMRKRFGARTLFTMKQAIGPSQQILWAARSNFIRDNRAALLDFMEDYVRGLHWFFDPANRTPVLAMIAKFNKRPVSAYSEWALTNKDYYRDPYAFPDMKALQDNVDLQRDFGFIKEKVDVKAYADFSLIEETKKRLGGKTPAGWQFAR